MDTDYLQPGESLSINSAAIKLKNGELCTPQHYLNFSHTYDTVLSIVDDIQFEKEYPIFVCQEETGDIYIQIGIIGYDNYKGQFKNERKIVYGRKWRIEKKLPTSEIVQTVFLALQKAREHEVRELFCLNVKDKVTTPFNCHIDLPLLSRQKKLIKNEPKNSPEELYEALKNINYDGHYFYLVEKRLVNHSIWLVQIKVSSILEENKKLPELKQNVIYLLLNSLDKNHLYHKLMDELIRLSNNYVAEILTYKNCSCFNKNINVDEIADLSIATRKKQSSELAFELEKLNYQTDLTRVPRINRGKYKQKALIQVESYTNLSGVLPIFNNTEEKIA